MLSSHNSFVNIYWILYYSYKMPNYGAFVQRINLCCPQSFDPIIYQNLHRNGHQQSSLWSSVFMTRFKVKHLIEWCWIRRVQFFAMVNSMSEIGPDNYETSAEILQENLHRMQTRMPLLTKLKGYSESRWNFQELKSFS